MVLFETVLQNLRYGARTLLRNAGFTAVSLFALALGIGVNTAVFTAYQAFIARPLEARDASTMVNFSLTLQSGATNARFSCPDYEANRDTFVPSAVNIDQVRLTDAGGSGSQRGAEGASLIGRQGL